jgi:hypothetical protein
LKDNRFYRLYSIALVDRQAIESRRESVGWPWVRRLEIVVRSPLNGPMRQKNHIFFSATLEPSALAHAQSGLRRPKAQGENSPLRNGLLGGICHFVLRVRAFGFPVNVSPEPLVFRSSEKPMKMSFYFA